MTGKDYMKRREDFIKALAWLLVQQQKSEKTREERLEAALNRIGSEVREEVEKLVSH